MNPAISDWCGKRVWLLGASSGIGAALAQELLRRGARVALSGRKETLLRQVAGDRPDALVLPCDALYPVSMQLASETLMDAWDGIDVAIYLAAGYQPMRAWELELEDASRMIDINLRGERVTEVADLTGFPSASRAGSRRCTRACTPASSRTPASPTTSSSSPSWRSSRSSSSS